MADEFMQTTPGTQMSWEVKLRPRGCWKCKLRRLAGMGYKHWNCGPSGRFIKDVPYV